MRGTIQILFNLQNLEFSDDKNEQTEAQIAQLRGTVPAQIMGHYDRLRARNKKGVAVVRNQACTGCHMRLPIGQITILMRDEDIQLCESCGRYLFLPPVTEAEAAAAKAEKAEKAAPKTRKRKAAVPAA